MNKDKGQGKQEREKEERGTVGIAVSLKLISAAGSHFQGLTKFCSIF